MTTKIKDIDFQVVDFRYDEGLRGRVESNICPTITTKSRGYSGQPLVKLNGGKIMRIRKLTETECMRLMGFEDKDTQAMKGIGMSASAIYHCAGDSIVVPCLIAIFSEFFNEQDKHIEIIDNYVERVKE